MPTVDVYGNSPDTGPGHLSATVACEDINLVNPTWNVAMVWSSDNSSFTSATANGKSLKSAVEKKLPGYQYALAN